MAARLYERSALALAALQLFPPSIRDALVLEPAFRNSYGFDQWITFGQTGVSVQQSELFTAIRAVLGNEDARPVLRDAEGKEWQIELSKRDGERRPVLSDGKRRLVLSDFSVLSPDQTERIGSFNQEANTVHLPDSVAKRWREILTSRPLADDEIAAFHTDIAETPIRVEAAVISEIEKEGQSRFQTLVPCSEQYFDRLVGEFRQSQNITDYVEANAKEHIRHLLSWRAYDGFLLSLLLASHSSISSAIQVDKLEEKELIHAYKWLQEKGDRISQIGAVETGLSILDQHPKIEPFVRGIIEQIRDDDTDDKQSRFHLLSALIMLVEGEISRTKTLRGKPPFWRRLAAIAQASLLERCLIKSPVDIAEFAKWAREARGQLFYLQAMVDLQREPRWSPYYVSPQQLKAEFIGRIFNASQKNTSKIHSPAMRELLFGDGPRSVKSLIEFPFPFLPGPLEGGLAAPLEPPAEILKAIEEQLSADVLQLNSFTALVNSALLFHLDSHLAQLAAKALRAVKYQLRQADSKEQLFSVLIGLANVAAVTRSGELAEELRILTRRCRHEPGYGVSAEMAMWIGLNAAAAHPELEDWCEFAGEWITELAFESLKPDETERLLSHVEELCHIVPELWRTCGRAEAALNALIGS